VLVFKYTCGRVAQAAGPLSSALAYILMCLSVTLSLYPFPLSRRRRFEQAAGPLSSALKGIRLRGCPGNRDPTGCGSPGLTFCEWSRASGMGHGQCVPVWGPSFDPGVPACLTLP
jgi:hypothetical protein